MIYSHMLALLLPLIVDLLRRVPHYPNVFLIISVFQIVDHSCFMYPHFIIRDHPNWTRAHIFANYIIVTPDTAAILNNCGHINCVCVWPAGFLRSIYMKFGYCILFERFLIILSVISALTIIFYLLERKKNGMKSHNVDALTYLRE